MRRKTIALFMLVIAISAETLLPSRATAKPIVTINGGAVKEPTTEAPSLSANDANISLENSGTGLAVVTFENYTPWNIQCYVSGTFMGVVCPGRTLSSCIRSGWTRPYARVVFVDGSSLNWDVGDVLYFPGASYAFPMYP